MHGRAELPERARSRTVAVLGSWLHYLEWGDGAPIVFLHGNPTSSYLWRHILPYAAPHGRCLAVDLIGMGRSGKPSIVYRLRDHIAYIDAFIDALGLDDITFVMHDWGVALGLHYLTRHPTRTRAVAFMEGHLHPIARWDDFDAGARSMFAALRREPDGRRLVIEENFLIEKVLPSGMHHALTAAEWEAYRAPYLAPPSREPLWRWPQEIPIAGEPIDVRAIVSGYQAYLPESGIPKLLIHAQPGAVIGAAEVAWCEAMLSNLTVVDVGAGIHFLPEDQPDAIGVALARWLAATRRGE
jgi:haloalkane dehalogenase